MSYLNEIWKNDISGHINIHQYYVVADSYINCFVRSSFFHLLICFPSTNHSRYVLWICIFSNVMINVIKKDCQTKSKSKCKPLYNFNIFNGAQMNFYMMNKTTNPNFVVPYRFYLVTSNLIRD